MYRFYRRHYTWVRFIPRKKHLSGGRLHRLLGEKLFAADLWLPSRRGIAGGVALGLFIGLTPTMGVQLILAGICAYALKVNVALALAATLVTNPLTAAVIYPLEYEIGLHVVGPPEPSELAGYSWMLQSFVRHAKPLWAGSLLAGSLVAAIAYSSISLVWVQVRHLHDALRKPGSVSGSSATAKRHSTSED